MTNTRLVPLFLSPIFSLKLVSPLETFKRLEKLSRQFTSCREFEVFQSVTGECGVFSSLGKSKRCLIGGGVVADESRLG